jgi:hypothetical protein
MEAREPDIDQVVLRVERAMPAYRIGRDNRSPVDGDKRADCIEPRSDFLDASVDHTDARNAITLARKMITNHTPEAYWTHGCWK